MSRGAGRTSAEQAEAKIRARFGPYLALPARKVTTMRPPEEVASTLAALPRG